jgi:cold shock CspA family protein
VRGTVVFLAPLKGYGFIRGENGVEFFFHRSVCWGRFALLRVGTVVTFDPRSTPRGPRASDVRIVEGRVMEDGQAAGGEVSRSDPRGET